VRLHILHRVPAHATTIAGQFAELRSLSENYGEAPPLEWFATGTPKIKSSRC
jgi:hypothetical protein